MFFSRFVCTIYMITKVTVQSDRSSQCRSVVCLSPHVCMFLMRWCPGGSPPWPGSEHHWAPRQSVVLLIDSRCSDNNVPEVLTWIQGKVRVSQWPQCLQLPLRFGHMRLDISMLQEEPRVHCTSGRSEGFNLTAATIVMASMWRSVWYSCPDHHWPITKPVMLNDVTGSRTLLMPSPDVLSVNLSSSTNRTELQRWNFQFRCSLVYANRAERCWAVVTGNSTGCRVLMPPSWSHQKHQTAPPSSS